MTDAEKEYC